MMLTTEMHAHILNINDHIPIYSLQTLPKCLESPIFISELDIASSYMTVSKIPCDMYWSWCD